MRSRSYEEDVEGEGFESENITLDTKHEDSTSKSKNTLSEVEAIMVGMQKPPPKRFCILFADRLDKRWD
jgi:hypothetical protein